jgi:hypothetical protein
MSLYLDVKYLSMISHKFEMFKRKDDYLFNVRCPICGDSQKNKRKMRGYFYKKGNDMFYKCHNCDAGTNFGNILKQVAPLEYKEYLVERYKDSQSKFKAHTKPVLPDFKPDFRPKSLLDSIMDRLDTLPHDHEAVKYCESRAIPKNKYDRLYYIHNIKDIVQLNKKYKDSIVTDEPRLAIPCFSKDGQLQSVALRGMRDEALRYIVVKVNEDAPTVFGLDAVNDSFQIPIVEGQLDSLFLENALAVSGTSFGKIEELCLPKEKLTIVFDNQPKNKEICKLMSKYIDLNYSICIWPSTGEGKDINEMVLSGLTKSEVSSIINRNTFIGLRAQMKFTTWKKC